MSRVRAITLASAAFVLVMAAAACGGGGDGEKNPFNVKSELVTNAAQPDAMQFAPDGRLFFIEHWTGNIRVIDSGGTLLPDPFAHVDAAGDLQIGLTGLALDPDFQTNHFVYVFFTEPTTAQHAGKPAIVRFTDQNNKGADRALISDDFPEVSGKPFNVNGRMHFGPDGFLYLTLGDYDLPDDKGPNGDPLAQDLGSPIGKVLRLAKDGSPAPGNPYLNDPGADPRIFGIGFRAAYDFAFKPPSGPMYGSDSTGVTCEELNVVEAGKDYGWPEHGPWPYNDCDAAKKTPAVFRFARPGMKPEEFDSSVGLGGMEFISGSGTGGARQYPTLGDSLLVCESRTQFIRAVNLGAAGGQITASEPVVKDCWLDIVTSPDGTIYYGNLTEIRRLIPIATSPQQ